MERASLRRPAIDLIRDVRRHGADLEADFFARQLYSTAPLPAWLIHEIEDRKSDLLAIFEEFSNWRDTLIADAVTSAESLLTRTQVPRRRRQMKNAIAEG